MNISIQPIIDIMNELTEAHEQLLALSEQKLMIIKNNNMEQLSKILNTERKYIQTTEHLETKRQKIIENFIEQHEIPIANKTISELLQHLTDEKDKAYLEQLIVELIEVIVQLRGLEQLNEELLQQSMAFIQTSLDLFDPTMKNFNYNDRLSESSSSSRSVFDSKA